MYGKVHQPFFLVKFRDLAKKNFKMIKKICFSDFMVTIFLNFFLKYYQISVLGSNM